MTQGGVPRTARKGNDMAEANTPPKVDEKSAPKAGDKVENIIFIRTRALAATPAHDEDANEQFLALYKGKKLENVEIVSKVHDIGTGITYTFSADVK